MLTVKQFRYSDDNLGYLIYGKTEAMAIDGGAVKAILSFVEAKNLRLSFVTNTHSHPDHTMGNSELLKNSRAEYLEIDSLIHKKGMKMEGCQIKIYHTPGHTADSIVFHLDNILITGDTLFNGKVGRCFSGDLNGFLNSAKILMALPEETTIYAGHDYVEEYMEFAKRIEPDNPHIDKFLETYTPSHVFSTLDEEMKINPHLRFNDPAMISILKKMNLPVQTEFERWSALLSME